MLHIPASLQIDGLYSCFSGVCQAGNKSRARYCSLPGRVGKRWWRAALCMPRCSAQKQQCHGSPGGSTAVPRSLQSACEVQISSQDTLCPPASDFQPCLKFCALSPALQELRTDCSSQADKSPLLAYLCLLLQRVGGEVLPHSHLTPSTAGMSPPWLWCCFIPSFLPCARAATCLPTSCAPQAPRCSAFLALGRYFGCVAFQAHKGYGDGSEAALHLIRLD